GEGGERPRPAHVRHAHTPLEVVHARPGRPAGQLARGACAVLPRHGGDGGEIETVHPALAFSPAAAETAGGPWARRRAACRPGREIRATSPRAAGRGACPRPGSAPRTPAAAPAPRSRRPRAA